MKDSEFIELLNLYLDAEISPTEASRLEAEVQRNPQRYQVYLQYCRMQKACTLLAADFTTDAPSVVALKPAPGRSAGMNLFAVAGAMAAAACLAFVFVTRTSPSGPTTNPESQAAAQPALPSPEKSNLFAEHANPERTIPQTVTVPERHPEFKPVLVNSTLLAGNAAGSESMQDARLDWLGFRITPLNQVETLRFDPQTMSKPTQRGLAPAVMQNGEQVGFEFRR